MLWAAIALGVGSGGRPDYAVLGAIGATIGAVVGLALFWSISGSDGACWRRGVDWSRRLALRGQVLIVLAGAGMVPLGSFLLQSFAVHTAPPATFGAVALVGRFGGWSFRLLLVALVLWLLVRRGRPASAGAETAASASRT